MLYFLDTSAMVKRYRAEVGTAAVDALFQDESNALVVSALSITETARALDTHVRRGEISVGDARLVLPGCLRTVIGARSPSWRSSAAISSTPMS